MTSGVVLRVFSSLSDTQGWRSHEWTHLKAVTLTAPAQDWQWHAQLVAMHLFSFLAVQLARSRQAIEMLFEAAATLGAPSVQGMVKLRSVLLQEDVQRFELALHARGEETSLVEAGERYVAAVGLVTTVGPPGKLGRMYEDTSGRRLAGSTRRNACGVATREPRAA